MARKTCEPFVSLVFHCLYRQIVDALDDGIIPEAILQDRLPVKNGLEFFLRS